MATRKKKQHYVDNVRLYDEMVIFINKYRAAVAENKTLPQVPEYVGEAILKIATHLAMRPNFIGYTYRDEMIGDGIENVLTYIHNYNPEKYSNPFAYFTQIIYFAFLRRLDKEKKESYIKHKMMENGALLNMLSEQPANSEEDHHPSVILNSDGRLNDLINKFEKRGKKSTKKKGVEKFEEADPPFIDLHPSEET